MRQVANLGAGRNNALVTPAEPSGPERGELDSHLNVLDRIAAIEPELRAQRAIAEASGRLPEASVRALIEAGITRYYLPASLGGLELDPPTCALATAAIARIDTAAAWFVMVANAARLGAAYWPEALVEEVWAGTPDAVVAASGNRAFQAVSETGGYRVSGQNSFVSGCHHAQWLLSPIQVQDAPPGPLRMALLPMARCEIVDNWHALGMRGTGSNDVRAQDLWVPEHHVVTVQPELGDRNRYYQGALYRCPSRVLFATYVPVTLVLAEQALAELDELARAKTPYAETSTLKNRSIAQIKYGRALAMHRASRGYFQDALETAWRRAERGEMADAQQKADLYLAGTHAVQCSAEVVRLVADAAGTSVIYQEQPLERIVRDMETLRHHGFASESRYGSVAQLYWDATLDYPLLLR